MRQLQNPEDFVLTDEDKITLLKISRQTLTEYILTGRIPQFDESEFSENLQIPAGAFVTLKKGEQLRGCIGRFEPSDPLWKVVVLMTIAAATEDPRFTPVRPEELDEIFIEISVLTPLKRVYSLDEIEIGKHGIYCREGFMSGTLLPQVAVEQGWDVWILGSEKDQPTAQQIQKIVNSKHCVSLTGKTSLHQVMVLLSLANHVISNDSGLMHVAAAVGSPVIAVYGSSDPSYTPPLSYNAQIAYLNLECSPCFKRECPLKHLDCLHKLTPDYVWGLLETNLAVAI